MDCPTCQGNGELEEMGTNDEHYQKEGRGIHFGNDRVLWPNTCPVCDGSGFLNVSF